MEVFEGTAYFPSVSFVPWQQASCANSLKTNHVIDTVIETPSFISAITLNHSEFVVALEGL